jgi:hypothetical protein
MVTDKVVIARVFIDMQIVGPMIADGAGLAGALLILAAYAGVQLKRIDAHGAAGLAMNFAGASLVMLSLLVRFNLGAFLLEAAWAVIALFGLVRIFIGRRSPGK